MMKSELTYKICIFGNKKVGKTTLTTRYLTSQFDESIRSTLGAAIHIKFLELEKKRIVLQIWDFGGEDSFRFLLPAYSRGSFGGIFMCDITNKESLEKIPEWISVFKEGLEDDEKSNPILMVGGKLDLKEKRQISRKDAEKYLKTYGVFDYIECSSKTGENVELIFKTLVQKIMKPISKI